MAQIVLTIPDTVLPRVLTAVAAQYGYDPNSGLTQGQFAKQVLVGIVKDAVKVYEGLQAAQTARVNTNTDVDTNVTVT